MAPGTDRTFPVSVVLADINRLKQVNDSFGHEAGDRLIASVGQAVSQASGLVPGSLAARIGGDEFCIVVTGATLADAVRVAEEVCRLVDGRPMSTGVSCGVASTDSLAGHVDSPVRLLRLADAAQYRAKRAGLRWPVVAGQVGGRGERRPGRPRPPPAPRPDLGAGPGDARVRARPARRDARRRHPDPARGRRRARVAPGRRRRLVGVRGAGRRSGPDLGGQLGAALRRPSDERFAEQAKIGAVFDLRDFPVTERAVRDAASFAVELGRARQRPGRGDRAGHRRLPRGHRRRCHRGRLRLAGRGVRRHPDACRWSTSSRCCARSWRWRSWARPTRRSVPAYRPLVAPRSPGRPRCSPATDVRLARVPSPRTRGEACRRSSRRSTTPSRSTRRHPSCASGSSRAAPRSTTRRTPARASCSPVSGCGCSSTRARSSRTACSPTSPRRTCRPTVSSPAPRRSTGARSR